MRHVLIFLWEFTMPLFANQASIFLIPGTWNIVGKTVKINLSRREKNGQEVSRIVLLRHWPLMGHFHDIQQLWYHIWNWTGKFHWTLPPVQLHPLLHWDFGISVLGDQDVYSAGSIAKYTQVQGGNGSENKQPALMTNKRGEPTGTRPTIDCKTTSTSGHCQPLITASLLWL